MWSVSFSPDGTKVASRSFEIWKIWDSSTGECTFTGEALPNPEEFPDMESKATPDVNGYVGFQNFKLKMIDDHHAVHNGDKHVHILKLVF